MKKAHWIRRVSLMFLSLLSANVTLQSSAGENLLPKVVLTSPKDREAFTNPTNIVIRAEASDTDGVVKKVDFFAGDRLLGSDDSSPYSLTWTNPAAGAYLLTARATDDKQAIATSAAVSITVGSSNRPPTVAIVSPVRGSTFPSPATISILAEAADPDGFVRTVEFFQNGKSLTITTNNPASASALNPFRFTWTNVGAGEYDLTARATDNAGSSVLSVPVRVIVTGGSPTGLFSAKINFQPAGVSIPTGYRADTGLVYGPRGDGLSYGWNADNQANTRNRNSPLSADQRYDTFAFMQRENQNFTWQLAVPNGSYEVRIAAGDPSAIDSIYGIDVEGIPMIVGTPTDTRRWLETIGPVRVNDGRLTVSNRPDARNNKISFIEVKAVTAGTIPPKVQIMEPADRAVFLAGTDIQVRIETADADGYIPFIELFAGTNRVAFERRDYLVKPAPGEPAIFHLTWKGVPAGNYALVAKATDDSGSVGSSSPVNIQVVTGAGSAIVTVLASDPEVSENNPQNTGVFKVLRTGNLTSKLNVHYSLSGNASNGIDYERLPGFVTIAPGESAAAVVVKAISDKALEGKESVILTLDQLVFAAKPPPEEDYIVGSPKSAVVTIYEDDVLNLPPRIVITSPRTESTLNAPTRIEIVADATDNDGRVAKVEFFANDKLLGVDELAPFTFAWSNVPAGTYVLTAKATDNLGATTMSQPVKVTVTGAPTREATLIITSPTHGAVFTANSTITIKATATDPLGYIARVEFFANGQNIGVSQIAFIRAPEPGTPILHQIEWKNVPAGIYELIAKAVDSLGRSIASTPVKITVGGSPTSFAERRLPANYTPGVPVVVSITVTPASGVGSYAIEDKFPSSWSIAGSISNDGAYDPVTRQVKFGPFFDNQRRVLTYSVRPPAGESGERTFTGTASVDGVNSVIGGTSRISGAERHPADLNPANNSITLSELTAYGAAWRTGKQWPADPNPIPISYVTRAGAIWKSGEAYLYDPSAGPAPLCWVSASLRIAADGVGIRSASSSGAMRAITDSAAVNTPTTITIHVRPSTSVFSQAAEEEIPLGLSVSGVSDDGNFDSATRTIRWGPFFDNQPRELRYQVRAVTELSNPLSISGLVSFDGSNTETAGQRETKPRNASGAAIVHSLKRLSTGGVEMTWQGEAGATYAIEATHDLNQWIELGRLTPGETTFHFTDPDGAVSEQRFYRARRLPAAD